ncbi:hypothetical protein BN1263400023 [Stenotrophomonas indicatrix]|nr:hypothetical protein BN1263400023 [Stenotrophomonas indicatrix]
MARRYRFRRALTFPATKRRLAQHVS